MSVLRRETHDVHPRGRHPDPRTRQTLTDRCPGGVECADGQDVVREHRRRRDRSHARPVARASDRRGVGHGVLGAAVLALVAGGGDDYRILDRRRVPDRRADGPLIERVGGRHTRGHADVDHGGPGVGGMHDRPRQRRNRSGLPARGGVIEPVIAGFEGT